jgi:adenylosuccinate lyase
MDLNDLDYVASTLKLLGNKGATGTQASFLDLFGGDHEKVKLLEKKIVEKLGMNSAYPVSGQTYPRKLDSRILACLSGVAQSMYKFAQDMRLLQSFHEMEEPFAKDQVGSSAMAYKRNPMRSERICSLSRHVMALENDAVMTACTQWFERTLDDSANRRISLPEAFLATDAALELYANVANGIVMYPKVIEKHLMENLPFMATENILMEAVKAGGDRQALHEKIRVYSQEATLRMRGEGLENDLIRRIAADDAFTLDGDTLSSLLDTSKYVGRSAEQVDEFVRGAIDPVVSAEPAMREMGDIRI